MGLIEEVPTKSEVNISRIDGVVRSPEHATATCIEVVAEDIETTALEVEVHIGTDNGVVAYLDTGLAGILCGVHADGGSIVGCIERGVVADIATKFDIEDLEQAELEIEIAVEVELGQW